MQCWYSSCSPPDPPGQEFLGVSQTLPVLRNTPNPVSLHSVMRQLCAHGVNLVSCCVFLRPPATPLASNSTPPQFLLPAKTLSSAAAASISSSSLQRVTPVTLFWVGEGPTGECINVMINPPFHVAVFKHSFTTKCFEGALHSQNTHKYFASVTTELHRCAAAQMLVKNYIYKYLYIYLYIPVAQR